VAQDSGGESANLAVGHHPEASDTREMLEVASHKWQLVLHGDGGLPNVVVTDMQTGVLELTGDTRRDPRGVLADFQTRKTGERLPGVIDGGGAFREFSPGDAADVKCLRRVARRNASESFRRRKLRLPPRSIRKSVSSSIGQAARERRRREP
jgi:hypothetical protein